MEGSGHNLVLPHLFGGIKGACIYSDFLANTIPEDAIEMRFPQSKNHIPCMLLPNYLFIRISERPAAETCVAFAISVVYCIHTYAHVTRVPG